MVGGGGFPIDVGHVSGDASSHSPELLLKVFPSEC